MDKIFHEKQEGGLCAQHCLNSLLQGQYFSPVDLAQFARDLDDAELMKMAEGDMETKEYLKFMERPSENVDDSGFFSVQVLAKALKVFNLELLPFNSERCKESRENPLLEQAYICNHNEHWLCLRKLGLQWFNLDSLIKGPELVSDTYLNLLLEQLRYEGYSIFVVDGILPPCEADEALLRCPVDPKAVKKEEEGTKHQQEGSAVISGQGPPPHPPPEHVGDEDDWELAMAISASLQQQGVNALMKGLPAMQLYMFVYCTDVYDRGNWLFAQSYCSSVRLTRTCAKSVCRCVADKCMHDQVLWCDGITLVGCACSLSCSGYPMNMWTVDKVVS